MSAKVLTHPTLAALATEVMDVITHADHPATDVDIALTLDQPIAAVRSALSALWLADLIAPSGSVEWTPVQPAPTRFVEFNDEPGDGSAGGRP